MEGRRSRGKPGMTRAGAGCANGRSEILVLVPDQVRDDNVKSGMTIFFEL